MGTKLLPNKMVFLVFMNASWINENNKKRIHCLFHDDRLMFEF